MFNIKIQTFTESMLVNLSPTSISQEVFGELLFLVAKVLIEKMVMMPSQTTIPRVVSIVLLFLLVVLTLVLLLMFAKMLPFLMFLPLNLSTFPALIKLPSLIQIIMLERRFHTTNPLNASIPSTGQC